MRIPALRFQQHGETLYVTVLNAKWLVESFKAGRIRVDVWSPQNPNGYQRAHSKSRAKEFAKFISAGEISPPSILLSIRGEDAKKVKYESGVLEIPDNITIYIVDGQHRIWGFRYASEELGMDLSNYNVAAVIIMPESSYEEAKQFVIINKTQKGVRTDLAERFLARVIEKEGVKALEKIGRGAYPKFFKGLEWKSKAIKIVEKLNRDPNSVWHLSLIHI